MILEYQLILTVTFTNDVDAQVWMDKIKQAMPSLKSGLPTPSAGPHITKRNYYKDDAVTEAI